MGCSGFTNLDKPVHHRHCYQELLQSQLYLLVIYLAELDPYQWQAAGHGDCLLWHSIVRQRVIIGQQHRPRKQHRQSDVQAACVAASGQMKCVTAFLSIPLMEFCYTA